MSVYNRYTKDGKIFSWGERKNKEILYEYTSDHKIEKRGEEYYTCFSVISSSGEGQAVGDNDCAKIIEINDKQFITENGDGFTSKFIK